MTAAPDAAAAQREPELTGRTVAAIGLTGATHDIDGGRQLVASG